MFYPSITHVSLASSSTIGMPKNLKLSGLPNLVLEHRFFFKKYLQKYRIRPNLRPLLVSTTVGHCSLLFPLHIYPAPHLPAPAVVTTSVIALVAAHSEIVISPTHFLLLTTHRHQSSSTSSHHTHISHRISGIARRNARIKLSLMDSSAGCTCAALVTSSFLVALVPYALTPLSWAFCRLRNNTTPIACSPLYTFTPDVFGNVVSCTHVPPLSVPIVFLHLSFPVVTVVRNLPHSFLLVLSFWCRYLFDPSFYPIDSYLVTGSTSASTLVDLHI